MKQYFKSHCVERCFFFFNMCFLSREFTIFYLFIYLLTLLKVNYKTLAAYALIKIDYPPFHKKHNKNVNNSVKEKNRMRMEFFQINPTC